VFSATRPARGVREVAPNVPEELARVVDQALGFSRALRFADAGAMRGALRLAAPSVLGEPFSPISPRIPQSARVSTHDDVHGATLLAPVEVTSAITGRSETGTTTTGQPVTRSTVVSGRPTRSKAPLLALIAALALVGLAVVLFATRRPASADPSISPAAPLTASRAAQPSTTGSAAAQPAVAAILDSASTVAAPVSTLSASSVRKPPPVTWHPVTHPPAPVFEKAQAKSLLGGDNPFDRRH